MFIKSQQSSRLIFRGFAGGRSQFFLRRMCSKHSSYTHPRFNTSVLSSRTSAAVTVPLWTPKAFRYTQQPRAGPENAARRTKRTWVLAPTCYSTEYDRDPSMLKLATAPKFESRKAPRYDTGTALLLLAACIAVFKSWWYART